jgi:DNA-directed RNA polymerase subunit RPC12/RpoP
MIFAQKRKFNNLPTMKLEQYKQKLHNVVDLIMRPLDIYGRSFDCFSAFEDSLDTARMDAPCSTCGGEYVIVFRKPTTRVEDNDQIRICPHCSEKQYQQTRSRIKNRNQENASDLVFERM